MTKINPAGNAYVYSTYLGGSSNDEAFGIAVGPTGQTFVTGFTASTNFPTANPTQGASAGASSCTFSPCGDAFLTALDEGGTALRYSSYLGGSGEDQGQAVAVDGAGRAYVVGYTYSTNFPTTTGSAQRTNAGIRDAFVARVLVPSGGVIPWHPRQSVHFSAGLDAHVDLTDGHIDVRASDLSLPARGLDLMLAHTWDSALAAAGASTAAGPGWQTSLTPRLGGALGATASYTDTSGAVWTFTPTGSVGGLYSYSAPRGEPWKLTASTTGYTLTNFLTSDALRFDVSGRLMSDTDAYGNQNTRSYGAGSTTSPSSEANSGGRALAFTYNANGALADAQSPLWQSGGAGMADSQHVAYGYNGAGQMTTAARGAGTTDALTTTFGYSGTQMMTVTTPAGHVWTLGYDGLGRVTTITSPAASSTPAYTTRMTYGAGTTQVVRGLGTTGALTTTYTLDGQGEAVQTQDGLGHTTHRTYDADHDVTSSTDANGNQTSSTYQYVGTTGSIGLRTMTVLPAIGLYLPGNTPMTSTLTSRYDPTTYDLLESDKPEGGVALYAYDRHKVITSTLLVSDQGNTFCPNAVAQASGVITPQLGGTCSYTQQWRASVNRYDAYGQRLSTVDGRGFTPASLTTTSANGSPVAPTPQLDPVQAPLYTSTSRYTPQGDLQSESTPPITTTLNITGTALITTTGPVTTSYGYDGDGNGTGVTTANGYATTVTFDHLGRQTSTILPRVTLYDGSTSTPTDSTTYDGDGNVVQTRDANSAVTTSAYDPWQRLIATTDPVSGTTLYTYTATEQVAVQDPRGFVTQSAYDGAGRLTQTTDPSNNTTQYQYDPVGNTVAITGGTAGAATTIDTRTYDARNEVSTDTTSGPGLITPLTTRTFYDGDGNVAQVQQPNGDTVYNLYDLSDLLLSTQIDTSPVSKTGAKGMSTYDFYSYDAAGNQIRHSDADNRTDLMTLDAADRTVRDAVSTPGATGTTLITTTTSYDPDGNTVFWTRQTQTPSGPVGTQTDSATVDAADRQVATTDNGLTTRYGYDAAGRQRVHTIVDGVTGVVTTMDSEGRAVALSEGLGGSGPYVGRMGYNMNDLPVTATLPGGSGITEGLGYDSSSRLTSLTLTGPASSPATTTLSSSYAYGYNALNWTTSTTTLSGTDTLVHDAQGRLTSETGPQVVAKGGTYAWTYDQNGNLISQIGDDGYPVTYTYTQAITPNEVQSMVMGDGQPTAFYGYDVHGDTTAITDGAKLNTHLVYDSQARPVQIMTLDRGTPLTVTLTYNPSGQRASYHVVEPGQPTLDEQFTYRGDVLGQVRVTNDGILLYTDTYLYTEAGAPYELLRQQGGATNRYWYAVDGRGNVVALTDVTGKVVDRYAYDSWGELTSDDGVNESVPQQLRYAGYWYDEKVSWYWLRVRYYDPEIARFLAPDPSQQDGVRTYAYVNNDPIDATDPSGLHRYLIWAAAFIAPKTISYLGVNYAGDGRGFWNGMGVPPTNGDHPLQNSRGSSKAWNYVVIDDGLNRSRPTAQNRSGVTHSRSDAAFLIAKSGYANDPDLASVTYNKSNIGSTSVENIDVEINGASANPLIPAIAFAPPIRYRYSLQFQYLNGQPYLLSIWGQHTDFPSQELLVKCLDCGAGQILTDPQWHFTPKAGATPSDLYNTDYLYGPGQVQDIYLSGL